MTAIIEADALDEIRLDMASVVAAAASLRDIAEEVRATASDGDRSWSAMPAAFEMPGVSDAMPAMTHRSTKVADDLADSVDRLDRLLDDASFEFAEFRTSRAALAERISSFAGGLHAAVARHDAALPEPPTSSTPWQQVPALAIEDAALRTAVAAWNEQWQSWQRELAGRIRAISGGESTAGLATDGTDVRTASLVAPMPLPGFPSTPFQFPWPWLGAAGGTAAGSGSAVGGLSALGLLGILFGLSGDTQQQTPADAMRQRMAQADRDAWAWTHDPLTGKPREVAGGAGIMTDVIGPMTGAEAIKHARKYGRVPKKKPVGEVDTPEELVDIWKELTRGGKPMDGGAPDSTSVELPDGSRVQWRPDSQSGGPTIEINAGGNSKYKIHLPKDSPRHDLPEEAR
ncbi:hypothetical protein [Curtobacterium pusillum]|uniref:hypothetical protein n=1 Tax=Curtobacterium pusillum TaxID=69373 RepID=UPI0011A01002|nr:hypothetical protein [Curtobacterium pusillum]